MKIGELFAGYGGLGMGVQAAIGGNIAWFSEFDPAPSKILAHHWPNNPNHGDITKIDWSTVEPVDILTGGFPCQDVSLAGLRRGLKDGTRSGLWSEFARAIDALQPKLVVIENVRGLLSADAAGPMESDPWAMGDGTARSTLRALGAVLGDLADLGYDTEWCGVRAADAGAPHGRFRVFIVAYPSGGRDGGWPVAPGYGAGAWSDVAVDGADSGTHRAFVENADIATRGQRGVATPGETESGRTRANTGGRGGTSTTNPSGIRLETGRRPRRQAPQITRTNNDQHTLWGVYEPAIRRWEQVTGRLAPNPTAPDGKNGQHRLSAKFVEWMMGLESGHVTDVGLTRNEQLKALGNGVVPQQAELALRLLFSRMGVVL